ncbi:MAG TPA: hypothetical protein VLI41_06060 [Phenylobacterium sp.]|uniref:hypothetical protein n=1 Tax=Phenylobacterium sp. TaxID=1871053 RepID=UPI002C2A16D0|nr:hypothetical protein [Phenylobacterium sp.]HSV02753.1 hypothetical protein [Phenylobacterium sp.]
MAKLRYTRDELIASHDFARPHEAAGYRLHGGFDADGAYVSPRVRNRWPAVEAWSAALEARGWPLLDATTSLLELPAYPNVEQERLLLGAGFGQFLWNSLTVTGVIEARGKQLALFEAPDMQQIVVDDVADAALGHLGKGLFEAHGWDEGGGDARTPELGAHDQMWFAVRDTVFGKDAYPLPEVPENISRPEAAGRELADLPPGFEALIKMLMNVLLIEVRAESFFAFCCAVFRDPANFTDRRAAAEQAAQIVERIRQDEQSHVAYLRVALSELRSFTLKTVSGGRKPGAEILDPLWTQMVEWHGRRERELARERTRAEIARQVSARLGEARGRAFLSEFDALGEGAAVAA